MRELCLKLIYIGDIQIHICVDCSNMRSLCHVGMEWECGYVDIWGIRKQTIQQTLPEFEWETEQPLCKTLVILLLVVVTDTLECTVKFSVASAAATTINPVS